MNKEIAMSIPLKTAYATIDKLTISELMELNKAIVLTVKLARKSQAQAIRRELKRDDKVKFNAKTRGIIYGHIIDVKRTAAHVMASDGRRWRVALALLEKVA